MTEIDDKLARLAALQARLGELDAETEQTLKDRNELAYELRNTDDVSVSVLAQTLVMRRGTVHDLVRGPATRKWSRGRRADA
ncbi:MAG TPA: hypothetical protein VK735_18835 [Pseudonocardia sp.]|uniref:hypothetical protein n=1 Tax=Pseudonocardia sp. TaxID=60912 RepID=UPI002BF61DC6|nr:hypothetical protein [Pseudonocardia sp.]HTF49504.1 hypothetical protein [Pseudonocardia sp.]